MLGITQGFARCKHRGELRNYHRPLSSMPARLGLAVAFRVTSRTTAIVATNSMLKNAHLNVALELPSLAAAFPSRPRYT